VFPGLSLWLGGIVGKLMGLFPEKGEGVLVIVKERRGVAVCIKLGVGSRVSVVEVENGPGKAGLACELGRGLSFIEIDVGGRVVVGDPEAEPEDSPSLWILFHINLSLEF
jgi:hypothetical protein